MSFSTSKPGVIYFLAAGVVTDCVATLQKHYKSNIFQTKILPKIDREILDNEKLTQAAEGQPYSVKMPSQVRKIDPEIVLLFIVRPQKIRSHSVIL